MNTLANITGFAEGSDDGAEFRNIEMLVDGVKHALGSWMDEQIMEPIIALVVTARLRGLLRHDSLKSRMNSRLDPRMINWYLARFLR